MSCDFHNLEPVASCKKCKRDICSECITSIDKPIDVFFLGIKSIKVEEYCPVCYLDGIYQTITSREFVLKHIFGIIGLSRIVLIYQIFFGDYFLDLSSWLFLGVQFVFKLVPQIIVLLLFYSLLYKAPRVKKRVLESKQKLFSKTKTNSTIDLDL